MLTDPLLKGLVASGTLVDWAPSLPHRRTRHLLMCPRVQADVDQQPWKAAPGETPLEARERRRQFHALLMRFVVGDILRPQIHAKVLKPTAVAFRGIIEFRSGPPDPQTRLFCLKFSGGVWIACGFHLRDDLGDLGDPRWEAAAQATQETWRAAFGDRRPAPAHYPCDTKPKIVSLLDD
jgi:hypothetical protein